MKLEKIFSREYSVQYTEVSIQSLGKDVKKYIPKLVLSQTFLPEQGNEACYVDKNEWDGFLAALAKKYSLATLPNFIKEFHSCGSKYVDLCKKIGLKNLKKLENQALLKMYMDYEKVLVVYTAYLWMGYFLNNIYSEKGKNLLQDRKYDEKALQKAVTILFSPSKLCGVLALDAEAQKAGGKISGTLLKKLTKQYCWLACLDIHNDPWTQKDLKDFLSHQKFSTETKYSFVQTVKDLKLKAADVKLFRMIKELSYVKDMRDVYRRRGIYFSINMFDEIAKRLRINRHDLAYLTSEEIVAGLKGKKNVSKQLATDRKKGFLIYSRNGKIVVTHEKHDVDSFISRYVAKAEAGGPPVALRGTCASKGQAQGVVKIVLGVKDLAKVKQGDIMIALTTHPDFVSAMKRAGAIVTDEGGITSHAAIVSREFGIPCVVGTKHGTKHFKDGDQVLVKADLGIVEKV